MANARKRKSWRCERFARATDPPRRDYTARLAKIPTHIAVIMDGNGRWARSRGLPRLAGHQAGTENLRRVIRACVEFGIPYLTIYAFSTENWGRPTDEVQGLMHIIEDVIDRELDELHREGVQLRHIGRLERLEPTLREKVLKAIDLTKDNTRLTLCIAFNYGGRDEIVCAIQRIIEDDLPAQKNYHRAGEPATCSPPGSRIRT